MHKDPYEKEKVKTMSETTKTKGQCIYYYNEVRPADELVCTTPSGTLVRVLVHQFVRDNKFDVLNENESLDHVTPADWRVQVNNAAHSLEKCLFEVLDDINKKLHDGDYARTVH